MEASYEVRGGAAWIRFERPDSLNALTETSIELLAEYVERAAADDEVRAVVITGTGRGFCAGADLKDLVQLDGVERQNSILAFIRRVGEVFTRIAELPKPVVGAVNGIAVAGGLELVLCCDIVVAADTARFGDAHATFGLLPGAGSSARLPRAVSPTWAKYLLLTGRHVTASQAAAIGLANIVCPADELEATVADLISDLTQRSPLSTGVVKRLANGAADVSLDQALEAEIEAVRAYAGSDDMAEGLQAFNDRRKPDFIGR